VSTESIFVVTVTLLLLDSALIVISLEHLITAETEMSYCIAHKNCICNLCN